MTTPASQVQLTIVEDVLGELILLDAPATQVVVGTDLSDTAPLPIGTAAAGTSVDGARADHVHAHGDQTGTTLHAAATTSAAGFMSGADKTKLDNATASGTANTLVLRDSSGDFAANVISADLIGNVTGDLTGTASAIADSIVTSAKILDETIVNADISPTAGIVVSKLAPGIDPRQLLQTNAAGDGVEWTDNVVVPGDLTVEGDLTVNGTETVINTQTLTVEDKNIELGKVASPTDTTADGGGITLKGATDKTINWIDATDSWTSSEHVDLANGKAYKINGTEVLSTTALGSSVLITSANITDGTIVDADVNASAAIAGTKISPDFGSQTVETTGVFSAAGGAEATPSITFTGDLNTGIYSPGADQVAISTNGSEAARIDSSGRLLVGTSTARFVGGTQNKVQIEGIDAATSAMSLVRNSNDGSASSLRFAKSNGTTIGSNTAVTNNTQVGAVSFYGNDGSSFVHAANINCAVDGTTGTDDMPGRLVFSTTADGAASPTERLRITSAGVLQVADAGDITVGTTTGTKIGTATTQKIGFYNATPVAQPAAVADITTTATAGSLPTPDGSVTIADATTPTVTELLEYCVEIEAKLEAALGHLRTLGLIAT